MDTLTKFRDQQPLAMLDLQCFCVPAQSLQMLAFTLSYKLFLKKSGNKWKIISSKLGMHTRIFCFALASQCVNSPTEAARARALLTAREARLPMNLRAQRKLHLPQMTEVDIPKRD